ncbi:MAG: TonB-dependent receptor [Colwellia sp.]|nr:TonB-dependent receptor [Colwellia sp.]MCW8865125.1 TonB-dependent receptor [Colwellia sp.]MCW9081972.1 TonB-dependent receptor [Colwellia sp.]
MRAFLTPSAIAVKLILLSSITSAGVFSGQAFADDAPDAIDDLEVITITNQRHHNLDNMKGYAQGHTSAPDLADWLTSVPGANINSNGPITGIAQYRGLYGDRVAASLDGHPVIGAGPNAMDTPLSYSTPLIVDSMTVYRGVAPVSAGINTLGGAVEVKMRKAETMNNQDTELSGDLQAGYRSNNNAKTLSAVTNIAHGDIAVLLYGNSQTGDSMESGDGVTISPTDFDKVQLGGDVRYSKDDNEVGLSYHYTDTGDSGTPALPMDIEYIESHRITLDGAFNVSDWQGEWQLGYIDADHGMTNFLMRENNNPAKYRRNNATAETSDFKVKLTKEFGFGELAFGVDGYFATHDSVITNPNNMMFKVVNFNDVEDNRYGIFTQWQSQFEQTNVQLGVRLKRAEANAGKVSSSMAMMPNMMGIMAGDLQNDFNNANRKVSDNNVDIALNTQTKLSNNLSFSAGVGLKNRAPSYQERYLWTPMESTGGLADGHTYIGDINLKSETAYQLDLGLNYQDEKFMVAPHVFYQSIDDYIQGTPMGMADMTAKMMANMMSGDENPLKFTNVDAKLYGVDMNGYYNLTDAIQLSTIISYVAGERRDIDDNLYRIAPLNGQVNLSYTADNWMVKTSLVMAANQHKVSTANTEQKTAGYGVVNIDAQYYVNNDLTLRFGVDNLLDKNYQNHLGGYNRVKGTEIPVMSRLPNEGVSAWAEATYSF